MYIDMYRVTILVYLLPQIGLCQVWSAHVSRPPACTILCHRRHNHTSACSVPDQSRHPASPASVST